MEKRYLINNKIMQGGDIPSSLCYEYVWEFKAANNKWQQSLTELACDESELDKILYSDILIVDSNPIDITSITTVKDGKVYFKEAESESTIIQDIKKCLYESAKKIEYENGFDIVIQFEEQAKELLKQFTITRKL